MLRENRPAKRDGGGLDFAPGLDSEQFATSGVGLSTADTAFAGGDWSQITTPVRGVSG